MSTRTRIILDYRTGQFFGSRAVKELAIQTLGAQHPAYIPRALARTKGKTKNDKLMKLAEKLPVGWTLILLQEPRSTRKNRSLYWSVRCNGEV